MIIFCCRCCFFFHFISIIWGDFIWSFNISNMMLLPKTAANSELLVLLSHFLWTSMCSALVAGRHCHCQPTHPVRWSFSVFQETSSSPSFKTLKFILRSLSVLDHMFVCNIVTWAFLTCDFDFCTFILYFCICLHFSFLWHNLCHGRSNFVGDQCGHMSASSVHHRQSGPRTRSWYISKILWDPFYIFELFIRNTIPFMNYTGQVKSASNFFALPTFFGLL